MKRIIVFLGILIFCGITLSYSSGAEQHEAASWQNDFKEFIETISEAARKSAEEHDGNVQIEDLNKAFLGKEVRWTGTLKYVHKGRPYFKDSFIEIDPVTSMSCVMYYPAEDAVESWEQKVSGSIITYTGRISAVNVETRPDGNLFPYIDLVDVRPIK